MLPGSIFHENDDAKLFASWVSLWYMYPIYNILLCLDVGIECMNCVFFKEPFGCTIPIKLHNLITSYNTATISDRKCHI